MKKITYYIFSFLLFAGCSVLKLPETFRARENDWRMWGGQANRTNAATELTSPLKLLWEYDASAGFSPQSIVAADGIVFVANLQGEVHAVSVATGKKYGSYDFGSAIAGAPVVDRHVLYVALGQEQESLISYNLHTGRIKWRARIGPIETSPLLIGQKLLAVAALDGKVVAVDKYSGKTVWTYRMTGKKNRTSVRSSPASNNTVVIVGDDDGTVHCISADSGKFQWKFHTRGSVLSSPVIDGQQVYVASLDSTLYALDVNNGKEYWRKNLGGKVFGSISVRENKIYVGTANRMIQCVNKISGENLWSFTTKGPISGGTLISGDVLYVGCLDKTLYALDAQHGQLLWKYETPSRIRTVPIIHQNILLLPIEDRTVLAFTADGETQ